MGVKGEDVEEMVRDGVWEEMVRQGWRDYINTVNRQHQTLVTIHSL